VAPAVVAKSTAGELLLVCRRRRERQEGDRGEGNRGVRRLLQVRSEDESVKDAGTEKPEMPGGLIWP